VRILLDTHCWLWMQVSPEKIPTKTRAALEDPENELFFSSASSWEIAIKWALGKLPLPSPPREYVPGRMEMQGVLGLPVQHRHALHSAGLPILHRDPFDRLLIAQAQTEKLALATADSKVLNYDGVDFLWG